MKTVLLIESNPSHRVALALIVRCFGYGVVEAANYGEAWFACKQHHGTVHLVMMKAVLKNHGTSKFLAQLLRVYPQMRALLICDETPAERTNMPCGFVFLQKPFRTVALADSIRELLEGPKKRAATSLS